MTERYDPRQLKPYRRGLILGLTMAEIMILIIFLLLMALTAALAKRDEKIEQLSHASEAQELIAKLQERYPQAKNLDELFKDLVLAADAKDRLDQMASEEGLTDQVVEDAAVGRAARELAEQQGENDPLNLIRKASEEAKLGKKGQWPPFISLSEADGYFFESGSAQLRPEFDRALRTNTSAKLAEIVRDYGVNVIEVIGHTDEVPMVGQSNLDKTLIPAMQGRIGMGALQPTDNAGLAIARATSVARVLRADPRLRGVTILPLSGAQMIEPVDRLADGRAAGDDRKRRRIEIRVRRMTQELGKQAGE
ncbi:OmpA family protein [Sphingomonas jaspsi]|uniref:OmpA family protein n=1 Tax=Sphingomonas jaspsi TaxID=392409 RepID=UPI0005671A38|nr:OmpA family protein [Sphingomonas jaspsi]